MRQFYQDIIKRAGSPHWFDEYGVPRYEPFAPHRVANVYARETVLMLIHCRSCGKPFRVAVSRPSPSPVPSTAIAELITTRQLCYGDPPNIKCCPLGVFSGSIVQKVLEYWINQDLRQGWLRDPKFEIDFASLRGAVMSALRRRR